MENRLTKSNNHAEKFFGMGKYCDDFRFEEFFGQF